MLDHIIHIHFQRIDIGEIPSPINVLKDEQLKYTKIIRCVMNEFHYKTYRKWYKGVNAC